jgi:hypothetical protein
MVTDSPRRSVATIVLIALLMTPRQFALLSLVSQIALSMRIFVVCIVVDDWYCYLLALANPLVQDSCESQLIVGLRAFAPVSRKGVFYALHHVRKFILPDAIVFEFVEERSGIKPGEFLAVTLGEVCPIRSGRVR